jgi:desulfoferrodoxin (superoxide reductase-like protein)
MEFTENIFKIYIYDSLKKTMSQFFIYGSQSEINIMLFYCNIHNLTGKLNSNKNYFLENSKNI